MVRTESFPANTKNKTKISGYLGKKEKQNHSGWKRWNINYLYVQMTGCCSQKTIRNTNTCACTHTHLLELINKLSKVLEYKRNIKKSTEFII